MAEIKSTCMGWGARAKADRMIQACFVWEILDKIGTEERDRALGKASSAVLANQIAN